MIEKQSLNLSLQFLENSLNMLKEQKEQYFANSFLEQLENTAFELLEAINQKTSSVATVIDSMPTKISESFIELCLNSVAHEIKKLDLQTGLTNLQEMNKLAIIAYDLFCLAVYIRFTLDPAGSSLPLKALVVSNDSEKSSEREKLN